MTPVLELVWTTKARDENVKASSGRTDQNTNPNYLQDYPTLELMIVVVEHMRDKWGQFEHGEAKMHKGGIAVP